MFTPRLVKFHEIPQLCQWGKHTNKCCLIRMFVIAGKERRPKVVKVPRQNLSLLEGASRIVETFVKTTKIIRYCSSAVV